MTTQPDAKSTRAAKPRRMARAPEASGTDHARDAASAPPPPPAPRSPSKLDQLEALLLVPGGASIAELMAATGWQQHSVRGAMAGALRKRGLILTSAKDEGARRYRAERPA